LGEETTLEDDFFAEFDDADSEPEAEAPQEPAADELGEDFFASLGESSGFFDDLPDVDTTTEPETLDTAAIPDGQFLESLGIEDLDTDEEGYDWFALEED